MCGLATTRHHVDGGQGGRRAAAEEAVEDVALQVGAKGVLPWVTKARRTLEDKARLMIHLMIMVRERMLVVGLLANASAR